MIQNRLDEAIEVIKDAVGQAKEQNRVNALITEAVRTGFVETPTEGEAQGVYFDAVKERVIRVCFGYWNERRLPIGLRTLVEKTTEAIKADKREGGWSFGVPSELTIRRRANEAASKEFSEKHTTAQMLVCLGRSKQGNALDSLYLPNPAHFQDETKDAILKLVGSRQDGSIASPASFPIPKNAERSQP